ncbi:MAG: substrate-binding domain-containing protein [Elusimicrobia bacterium]|nr:substrate-binding domain-containing protein [Elusimicrobiota bacterium]
MNLTARNRLVVASLAVSVALGLTLGKGRGGGASAAKSGRPLIGLSLDTLKEERWQRDKAVFEAKAAEMGADLLVQAANSDDTRQMQDVQALISRHVGAIVIAPHNGAAMAKGVELAHEAGIPVISYDRLITGADVDLYVAFDAVAIGEAQAQALLAKTKGKGTLRLVRIQGAKTDHNSFLLKEGQDKVLAPMIESGMVKVLHEDWAQDWKPENAKKIMNAALTKHGHEIDAVLCANDGTAGGAIQALSEEGLAGKVVVIGQDAELAACQRVAAGTQAATIYKPTVMEVTAALDAAIRMIKGRPVIVRAEVDNEKVKVPSILKDTVAVTRENLMDTVVKDGYHPYDEVYKGVPDAQRPKRR